MNTSTQSGAGAVISSVTVGGAYDAQIVRSYNLLTGEMLLEKQSMNHNTVDQLIWQTTVKLRYSQLTGTTYAMTYGQVKYGEQNKSIIHGPLEDGVPILQYQLMEIFTVCPKQAFTVLTGTLVISTGNTKL